MNLEKSLSRTEITRVIEIAFLLALAAFSTYSYAMKVPQIEKAQAEDHTDIAVLKSGMHTMQGSLDRIENAVTRRHP